MRGPWRETDWRYRLDLFGPSGNVTRFLPAAAVVHVRYAVDPARPWHGLSPLAWARSTGTLAANLEQRLGEEVVRQRRAAYSRCRRMAATAAAAIRWRSSKRISPRGKGRALLVETTAAAWGEGKAAAPQSDWKQSRIGPDPPATLATLRSDAALAVLDACGVPRAMATDADGTAQREAWRRFVMGSVEPVARIVARELGAKLDAPGLAFEFTGLWGHDLAGRAGAFAKMVQGGMDIERAVALAGLMVSDQ